MKTRAENLISVFDGTKQKCKLSSIKDLSPEEETAIIKRLLKNHLSTRDDGLNSNGLIKKYHAELEKMCSFDKETKDSFGHVNTWWVFSEVASRINYSVFMAEAENIGYKRTKRGERLMPNDLYRSRDEQIIVDDGNIDTILDYMRQLSWE